MIYFDNAATGGKKPDAVLTAATSALKLSANPGRSAHRLSLACATEVQNCRHALTEFFDGYSFERVAFTKNCTEALNIAIFSALADGGHAVTTALEHNSVLRPLEYLKRKGVAEYDVCPIERGKINPQTLASFVRKDTKAVVVTSASNVTGEQPDLQAVRALLPPSVLFIVDGAQGGGHIPLKMCAYGIDALCLAGHKGLFALQGSGALLFSERFNPQPLLYGGTGSESFSLAMPDFYPDALESGTLCYPAVVSLLAGIRYLTYHGTEIAQKLRRLTAVLLRGLKKIPAYRAYSEPNPCGIVSFSHERLDSEYLALLLSEKYGFATRGGLHCAPLAHQAFGTSDGGLLRVSFGHDNDEKEVDALLFALKEIENNL